MVLKILIAGVFWVLTGCVGAATNATNTDAVEVESRERITTQIQITPTIDLTPQPTLIAPQPSTVALWFPETLAPLDNVEAAEMLSQQISAFQNEGVAVDFRLKSVDDVGGIMPTLRAASAVAPSVLPDLTLLRRSDLVAAADAGLIVPINERAIAAILGNYAPIVRSLGRVEGVLYGLPYNLDVQHLAGTMVFTAGDFDAVLESSTPLIFPAGATNTISDVLLAQYREAAGLLQDNGLEIEIDSLRTVFSYYERAVNAGLIDTTVLEYTEPDEYADLLISGNVAGVVTSTLYLDLLHEDDGENLSYASIPTVSGEGTTLVDGWMWVITTRDAGEQAVALRFISWMMDTERQAAYHQLIDRLPSQETALSLWEDADYAAFVAGLLAQGTLPLVGGESAITARAISSAFASVLAGRESAVTAAGDVLRQLEG